MKRNKNIQEETIKALMSESKLNEVKDDEIVLVANGTVYWQGPKSEWETREDELRALVQDVASEDGILIDIDEVDAYTVTDWENLNEGKKLEDVTPDKEYQGIKYFDNQDGYCPICNAKLHYQPVEYAGDDVVYYGWDCDKCGAKGEAYFKQSFMGHSIYDDNFDLIELPFDEIKTEGKKTEAKLEDIQMEIYEMIQNARRLDNQEIKDNIKDTVDAIKQDYPEINEKELVEYVTKKADEIYAGEYDEEEIDEKELARQLYGVENDCEYTPPIEESKKVEGVGETYTIKYIDADVDLNIPQLMQLEKEHNVEVDAKQVDKIGNWEVTVTGTKDNIRAFNKEYVGINAEEITDDDFEEMKSESKKVEEKSDLCESKEDDIKHLEAKLEIKLEDLLLHRRFKGIDEIKAELESEGIKVNILAEDGPKDKDDTTDLSLVGNVEYTMGFDIELFYVITRVGAMLITECDVLDQYDEYDEYDESKKVEATDRNIDKGKVLNMKYADLPDMCYGLLPSDNSVIVIKKGENGYYETDYGTPENPEEFVAKMNEKLGVTPEQRMVMELRSMSGNWILDNEGDKKEEDVNKLNNVYEQGTTELERAFTTEVKYWLQTLIDEKSNDEIGKRAERVLSDDGIVAEIVDELVNGSDDLWEDIHMRIEHLAGIDFRNSIDK